MEYLSVLRHARTGNEERRNHDGRGGEGDVLWLDCRFRLLKLRLSLLIIRVFTLLWGSGVPGDNVIRREQCEANGSVIRDVRRGRT